MTTLRNLTIDLKVGQEILVGKNEDKAKVLFRNPEYGVAPGQACVIYESQKTMARVLGGGWIIKDQTQNLN